MTEQDIRNRDLIFKLISENMGYDDESLAYFKKELYEPFIDDEFKKILGPDLRARFELDTSFKLEDETDEAWSLFNRYFHSFTCEGCNKQKLLIGKEDFYKNTVTYKKNEVKIKKVMVDLYDKFRDVFKSDYERVGGHGRAEAALGEINKDTIEAYIIKCFEEIGKYKKTGKSGYELVISMNFADWLMCSAKEPWTSCFDIEKGYYWFGVPGLIGDKNRAFVYVTDGTKKECGGIITDRFNARSWILLSENNKKNIVRFYPSSGIVSIKDVIKVTKDNSFVSANDARSNGKYPLNLLFFKKGVASTVSNDACKIEIEKGKPVVKIGYGGGIQYFNKALENPERTNFTNERGLFYYREGKTFNDAGISVPTCDCGKPVYKTVGGRKYCKECYEKAGFYTCEVCGNVRSSKDQMYVELDLGDKLGVKKACPSCVGKFAKCKHCGKLMPKETMKQVNGEYVCTDCYTKLGYKKCRSCQRYMPSSELIYVHDAKENKRRKRCEACINKDFPEHVKCPECGEYWDKEHIMADGRCKKCNGVEVGEAPGDDAKE